MRMRTTRFHTAIVLLITAALTWVLVGGCESKAETGALVGGAAGAGVGGLATRRPLGAVVGGAVGAGAGYLIGREAQKQQSQVAGEEPPPPPPPPVQEGEAITVNVTNSNGSVTPVQLRRQGSGWIGPRGEYYSSLPTPDQLRPLYGF